MSSGGLPKDMEFVISELRRYGICDFKLKKIFYLQISCSSCSLKIVNLAMFCVDFLGMFYFDIFRNL